MLLVSSSTSRAHTFRFVYTNDVPQRCGEETENMWTCSEGIWRAKYIRLGLKNLSLIVTQHHRQQPQRQQGQRLSRQSTESTEVL